MADFDGVTVYGPEYCRSLLTTKAEEAGLMPALQGEKWKALIESLQELGIFFAKVEGEETTRRFMERWAQGSGAPENGIRIINTRKSDAQAQAQPTGHH